MPSAQTGRHTIVCVLTAVEVGGGGGCAWIKEWAGGRRPTVGGQDRGWGDPCGRWQVPAPGECGGLTANVTARRSCQPCPASRPRVSPPRCRGSLGPGCGCSGRRWASMELHSPRCSARVPSQPVHCSVECITRRRAAALPPAQEVAQRVSGVRSSHPWPGTPTCTQGSQV